MADEQDTRRRCRGRTKADEPCGAPPLRPGTVVEGVEASGEWCRCHEPSLPSRTPLTHEDRVRGGEATRRLKPTEVLRERVEAEIDRWLRPYEEALAADRALVVGTGPKARVEVVPDLPTRMKAAEAVLNRLYGTATSRSEFSGTVTERRSEAELDREIERLMFDLRDREHLRTERVVAGVGYDEAERLLGEAIKRPEPAPEPGPEPQAAEPDRTDRALITRAESDPDPAHPPAETSTAGTEPEPEQAEASVAAMESAAQPEPAEPSKPQRRTPGWQQRALRDVEHW